jgi:hypothetical protein
MSTARAHIHCATLTVSPLAAPGSILRNPLILMMWAIQTFTWRDWGKPWQTSPRGDLYPVPRVCEAGVLTTDRSIRLWRQTELQAPLFPHNHAWVLQTVYFVSLKAWDQNRTYTSSFDEACYMSSWSYPPRVNHQNSALLDQEETLWLYWGQRYLSGSSRSLNCLERNVSMGVWSQR